MSTVANLEAILRLKDELSSGVKLATDKSVISFGFLERAGQRAFDGIVSLARTGVGAVLSFGQASTTAAMEAVESENLFSVSFKDMADSAREWSERVSDAVGTNEFALRRSAATIFTMTSSMGLNKEAAFGMATGMTELAGDMASFYNLPHEAAFTKLRAGIVGETEPLKQLGILVDDNTIKTVAYQTGIAKMGSELTQQQKVMARWQAILLQTKDAQGDLARTIDSPTNAFRVMGERVDELQIKFGTALLPALQGGAVVLGELLKWVEANEAGIRSLITNGLLLLSDGFRAVIVAVGAVNEGFLKARTIYIDIIGWITKMAFSYEFLQQVKEHPLQLAAAWDELKIKVQATDIVTGKMKASAEGQAASMRGLVNVVGQSNEKFRDLIEKSKDGKIHTDAFSGAVGGLGTNAGMTSKEIAKLAEETKKLLAAEAAESYQQMADELKAFAEEGAKEAAESLKAMTEEAKALREADLSQMADEASRSFDGMAAELKDLGDSTVSFKDTFKASFAELPKVMLAAIQGGGDVTKAAGTHLGTALGEWASKRFGETITNLLGKTIGSGLNAILPGLGAVLGGFIGSLAGKVGSFIGGLFGNKEIEKVNDLRDAFFQAHGGFEAFSKKMAAVSGEDWAAKIFKAKTVEDFNALVKEAQGLLDSHGMAQEAVNAAMEKYGFEIDDAAEKLDALGQDLFRNWELLTKGALIPAEDVILKMGPDLVDFVEKSKAAGIAIPENMRPVIEQLIASGQLLDENGEAFSSVEEAGISFSQSLTEGMKAVVEEVRNLIAALTGIPRDLPPIHQPVVYDDPGRPRGEEPPEGVPAYALGTPYVPRTGLAWLHQGEQVIAPGGGGSAGMSADLMAYMQQRDDRLEAAIKRAFVHAMQTR